MQRSPRPCLLRTLSPHEEPATHPCPPVPRRLEVPSQPADVVLNTPLLKLGGRQLGHLKGDQLHPRGWGWGQWGGAGGGDAHA